VEVIEIAYKCIITIFVERCVLAEDKAYTTLVAVDKNKTVISFRNPIVMP
jgi:hypothetical protein